MKDTSKFPEGIEIWSTEKGRAIFKRALRNGGMENYFSLAEQFIT